jgi:hypothetical protein
LAIFFYGEYMKDRGISQVAKGTRITMRKYMRLVLMICILGILTCGCGKKDKEEKTVPLTIYEQLKVTEESLPDEETKVIQKGVNSWAKAFLAVNSDAQDKEITDQSLYQSIANTEHRRLLKEERDAFYKESVVNINEVSTQVKSAKKAQYGKTDVGVVECDIDVKGTRNDQAFEKIYTMQMVVNYQTNVVSVYEVEDITWE